MAQTLKILLVDDEGGVLFALKMLLGLLPATITTASSGKDALSLYGTEPFDLVVSDLRMPEMDGMALYSELKKRGQALKFILISGHANEAEQKKALGLGINAFLGKPFGVEEMRKVIDAL